MWFPNLVLLPIGIVFLVQARLDTRLLETDFYTGMDRTSYQAVGAQ